MSELIVDKHFFSLVYKIVRIRKRKRLPVTSWYGLYGKSFGWIFMIWHCVLSVCILNDMIFFLCIIKCSMVGSCVEVYNHRSTGYLY